MNKVLFMGSRNQFPDCLLQMVESEVDASSAIRLLSSADLSNAVEAGGPAQLLVIEDALWAQFDPAEFADLVPANRIAIAFRHDRSIAQELVARADLPKGISFLPMDLNVESWLGIIRLLLTGCPYVPTELQQSRELGAKPSLVKSHSAIGDAADCALEKLTPRERDVLALVAEGMQNKIIAGRLKLSEHTVKLHLHHVISKLGARNRTEAALKFRRSGAA